MPRGQGVFYMAFTKAMQDAAKARKGDTVSVVMEPDTAPRTVTADLEKALRHSPREEKTFTAFSYSHRKERVAWIEHAKKPETRATRIENTLTMLGTTKTPKG